jgi:hypothetical protein
MARLTHQGACAILYGRQGRWQEAAQLAARIAQATSLLPHIVHTAIDGHLGWAEIALELLAQQPTDRERRSNARRAVVALRRYALVFPIGGPAAWRYHGRLTWQEGKTQTALRAWRRSLVEAQRLEMPYDEGLAHAELGLRLPPTDSRRRDHLVRGIAILARLGARADLERVISAARPPRPR